eukprot:CAMPEP_0117448576 /NCGR_PEP_ID=MMETSP0759-20121206/7477_1 /TAXON_ID=63605 /ORGANISM="Percolomonas cosmopolitus, Strain WS" /LENGTH=282 /DNA_ID=CAMNT_0005240977 /DNA_START=226 /DNA_END=1071 /DNA_ORIENTATION=-
MPSTDTANVSRVLSSDEMRDAENHDLKKVAMKFAVGGVVTSFVSGLMNGPDHVKTRLQIQGKMQADKKLYTSFPQACARIFREEGFFVLAGRGLGAALSREVVYSGIRMGLYDPAKYFVSRGKDASQIGFAEKFLSGAISGGIGSFVASPADLLKIRVQAVLPGQPLPYRNFVHGFSVICKKEGIPGLYKGASATVVRAVILTGSQLASYDTFKTTLIRDFEWEDAAPTHIVSSVVAGLITTTASSPVDVIKSRFMNDQGAYKNVLDCFVKTVKHDGVFALW